MRVKVGLTLPSFREDVATSLAVAAVAEASGLAGGCEPSVVSTAIAMPIMPNRLPRRLVSGCDSPRSARMNRTPAIR